MKSSASQALPPAPGTEPEKPADAGDFDPEPVEEHEDEEQDGRYPGDLLSGVELVYVHLHSLRRSLVADPTLYIHHRPYSVGKWPTLLGRTGQRA